MSKGRISKQQLEAIKARINMPDLVGEYTSDLKMASGNYKCPCLFHNETKPSMTVYDDHFHCYGCQKQGDCFSFIEEIEGVTFYEAVKKCAERAGIVIQEESDTPRPAGDDYTSKKAHTELHELATQFYTSTLTARTGQKALEYLNGRKVSQEMRELFRLGASPDAWDGLKRHLSSAKRLNKDAVNSRLLNKKKDHSYDAFRNRLMFPIQDMSGKIVAFGGRTLDDDAEGAKYINSAESDHFKKGRLLYGLFQSRKYITTSKKALLSEGYMDVIAMHQFGFQNTTAALGTAFGESHVNLLAKFCEEIILLFDGDPAGQKAAFKAATLILKKGLSCRVVLLPDGEDADSLLHRDGPEMMQWLIDTAPTGLQFCLEMIKTTDSPRRAIWWIKNFMANLEDAALRAFYIPEIVKSLQISEFEFRKWEECRVPEEIPPVVFPEPDENVITPHCLRVETDKAALEDLKADKPLLWGFIVNPEYVDVLKDSIPPLLKTDASRNFFDKLCAAGPELDMNLTFEEMTFLQSCKDEQLGGPTEVYQWYRKIKQLLKEEKC